MIKASALKETNITQVEHLLHKTELEVKTAHYLDKNSALIQFHGISFESQSVWKEKMHALGYRLQRRDAVIGGSTYEVQW